MDTDITLEKVLHNNGPWEPVDIAIDATATAPTGCTVVENSVPDSVSDVPVSVDQVVTEVWTVNCTETGLKTFVFDNTIDVATPYVSDPDLGNNTSHKLLTVMDDASTEDDIDGDWQPRSWDQRHAVTFGLNLALPRAWNVSVAGTYHSGFPTTDLAAELVEDDEGELEVEPVLGPRNGSRYPPYHRLDLRVTKQLPTRRGELALVLEVSNLLNRRNVCCIEDFEFEISDDGSVTVIREEGYWAPIIPSLGIRWRF